MYNYYSSSVYTQIVYRVCHIVIIILLYTSFSVQFFTPTHLICIINYDIDDLCSTLFTSLGQINWFTVLQSSIYFSVQKLALHLVFKIHCGNIEIFHIRVFKAEKMDECFSIGYAASYLHDWFYCCSTDLNPLSNVPIG